MTAEDAIKIAEDAQDEFVKDNIGDIIEKIDERIRYEAGGSKMFASTAAHIELSGDFSIINGGKVLEAVKTHYVSQGFRVEMRDQTRSSDYLVIGW